MDLVVHGEERNVTLQEVARRQAISEKYLWQIVNPLKTAGLIRAAAGPGGGYTLARPPATITLHDILAVLENDFALVACVLTPTTCSRSNACAAREIWREVEGKIGQVLASITLSDIADKQRLMTESESPSYAI
jgi:Rrf2 family protein